MVPLRYNKGIEVIVTVRGTTVVLKDKGGVAISGFEEHLEEFRLLRLQGTFNVVINGINERVFIEHATGSITRLAAWEPIYITDYQLDLPLRERLATVEGALVEHPSSLIKMVNSKIIKNLKEIDGDLGYNIAIARQDVKPVLRTEGSHSINVSFLL